MPANASNIWQVPAYLPYVQPPLTREALMETEQHIGFTLPQELVALLAAQNGGYIRWRLCGEVHDIIRGIGPHFPSLGNIDWTAYGEWLPFDTETGKFLVPFDGDGHWHLCLDYRRRAECAVVTKVDTEGVREEEVADSFADYLDMLEPDVDENEFYLPAEPDIEFLKKLLCDRLGMAADKLSAIEYGYPQHRLRRDGEEYPQCVWLSPNVVPRGFVRETDHRFAEVKDWMPGFALRFPGLPGGAWEITASDSIAAEVLRVLREAGISAHPLEPHHAIEA